jgi:hypothetical protein
MAPKKPNFIIPPNALKMKVGEGGIPAHVLRQCQVHLESNPVDFRPYGLKFLGDLRTMRKDIREDNKDILPRVVNTVMSLKSNGSMFQYQLVSMISDVMLRFMENVKRLDQDFIDIFDVYIKVLDIVFNKSLTGNGGREGQILTQEFHNACLRYYARNDIQV